MYYINQFWLYIAVLVGPKQWEWNLNGIVGKPEKIYCYGSVKSVPPPSYFWTKGSEIIVMSRRITMDEDGKM